MEFAAGNSFEVFEICPENQQQSMGDYLRPFATHEDQRNVLADGKQVINYSRHLNKAFDSLFVKRINSDKLTDNWQSFKKPQELVKTLRCDVGKSSEATRFHKSK